MSTDADPSTHVRLLEKAFAAAEALDPEGMAEAYAEDAVLEFPFAPENFPGRVQGRANIIEFFRSFPKYYRKIRFVDRRFMPLQDGSGLVAEYRGQWESHKGLAYHNHYIAVVRFRGEQVIEMREYFNPIVWIESLAKHRE